jgi:D-sedoheptulose 7-phosphate isomerase
MSKGPADLFQEVAANMTTLAAHGEYLRGIDAAVDLIVRALGTERKLLVFGNGGSAADAEHIAAEFVARFSYDRPALPAQALTVNTALVTAVSNDTSFDNVFARQIDAYGRPGDVAWGISTSGRSSNVLRGLERARARGLGTIGLCGGAPAAMARHCDVLLAVPLQVTARIQEVHLVTYHAICGRVEARLFPRSE